jgi:hypothetical protein
MNIKYFLSLAVLLSAQTAAATALLPSPPPVLLERVTVPGYPQAYPMTAKPVMPRCTINQVGTIVKIYDGITGTGAGYAPSFSRTTLIKFNLADLKLKIKATETGIVELGAGMVDTPTTEYYAYLKQIDGSFKKIVLWKEGQDAAKNNAPDAAVLRDFLDLACDDQQHPHSFSSSVIVLP